MLADPPIFSMMTSWLGSTSYSGSSSKGLRGIDLRAPCSGDSSKLTSCAERCSIQTAQDYKRPLNLSRATLKHSYGWDRGDLNVVVKVLHASLLRLSLMRSMQVLRAVDRQTLRVASSAPGDCNAPSRTLLSQTLPPWSSSSFDRSVKSPRTASSSGVRCRTL